jgi:hypothetical protein
MVALAAKPGMDRILPSGIAEASEKLLVASGVAGARTIRWSRSQRMVSVYEAVRDLFCQCAAIVGVGSRLAFTYIPTGADGRPDAGPWTGLMLWLQKAAGEPWTWSIRLEELGLFLEESGWTYVPEQVETARKRGVEFFAVATK